jgi:hypothetical protein
VFDVEKKVYPRTGHEDRDVGVLFLQPRCWMGMGGQCHALATLRLGKRPGTNCTGDWVGGPHSQSG